MARDATHASAAALAAGLDEIRRSPADNGVVSLIVQRPRVGEREVVAEGRLDAAEGLVGDNWRGRESTIDRQLTLMNARAIALVAGAADRWPLAGDQLFVDFDLSAANVPAGTRLAMGSAVVEVTAPPHLGCQKFVARFGVDAMKLVNSPTGRALNLRGINARVVTPGVVRAGDVIRKVDVQ